MGANELSALLWHERELLDLLIFKIEEEQLLLTAGKSRWLRHATSEVEQVVSRLRASGLSRALGVSALAEEWGVDGNEPSLTELANAAPKDGPWGDILRAHLEAMTAQTAQIKELRDANASFLRAASRSTQETAATLQPATVTYDAHGSTGTSPSDGGRLFDTEL
jgi:flagellar biosynthesis/type III secretory pathway chaperone